MFNGSAIGASTITDNARITFSTISLTERGIYVLTANVFLTFTTTTFTSFDMRIATDINGTSPNTLASVYNTSTQPALTASNINYTLSGIYSNTSTTTTLYFTGIFRFTGGTVNCEASSGYPEFFRAVRVG